MTSISTKSTVLGFVTPLLSGLLISLANIYVLDDLFLSYVFVIIYFVSLYTIWVVSNQRINLFLIFYLSFGLFVGGSFFAVVLGYPEDPFMPTFFLDYSVSYERRLEILEYVIAFIVFSILGYNMGYKIQLKQSNCFALKYIYIYRLQKNLTFFFPILVFLIFGTLMTKFMSVLSNGYLALYVGLQNDSYSNSNFVNVLFPIVFSLAITFGNNALKTRYILLFFIHALLNILMGTRSAFGAFLLICLWIYSMTHQISLKKIFFWCLLSIVMLLFVYSFSIRANEQGVSNESLIDKMLFFAFSQGGTLMTFDSSRLVENYPIIPYFQSFFPGAANIFSFLTGEELYHWNTSFSGYMDYQLNPDLYFSGCGLGWSILSDLYLFSGGTWIIFFFLSLIYGMFIAVLEKKAIHCNFFKYLGVSISYSLVLLPRGSLSSLFPLLIYSVFIWVIFLFCFQAWDKIREIKYYNKCNRRIN